MPGFKSVKDEKSDGKLSSSKKRGPTQDGTLHSYPPKQKKEKGRIERDHRHEAQFHHHMGGTPQMGNGTIFGGNNFILPLDPAAAALQQQILSGLGALGKCRMHSFQRFPSLHDSLTRLPRIIHVVH